MQQTLTGCAFCAAPPGVQTGQAHTWGAESRVSHRICLECAVQERVTSEDGHHACDGCGCVVDALAALTRFRVEVGHLEGPVRFCERCTPAGPGTYWTRALDEHLVTPR